ncbi:menaquinone-dependent protoporphyrinogen IX dehydrogenase [Ideonella sp. A 288]|uniref:menaquinone-dependent protoporphyrinogen IX dehydrogenase n=1 Tax=Ideonella sp. A 288 TaxID=1962181 RepID=UPI000B4B938B|nr:menaquinone-dependent protoporphyrinogen IX dehydrogenase [Ideonella sp. A 288]
MARILIAFSTVDGHTQAICERLRGLLQARGHGVTLASLGEAPVPDPQRFDRVVVGASIRYGKHRPALYEFIGRHRRALDDRPCAFFSVNAVARKPAKASPQTNPYMRGFHRATSWRPPLMAVFAGKIDYARYGLVDRQVIRLIMWLTGGPTGAHDCVDFTDWAAVDAFGEQVARLAPDAMAPP